MIVQGAGNRCGSCIQLPGYIMYGGFSLQILRERLRKYRRDFWLPEFFYVTMFNVIDCFTLTRTNLSSKETQLVILLRAEGNMEGDMTAFGPLYEHYQWVLSRSRRQLLKTNELAGDHMT